MASDSTSKSRPAKQARKTASRPAARALKATAPRMERLEARVSRENKKLCQRAAALQGRTLSDFIITSATQAAQQVVQEHEVIKLSARDSELFVKELLDPGPPNKALVEGFRWYKKQAERD